MVVSRATRQRRATAGRPENRHGAGRWEMWNLIFLKIENSAQIPVKNVVWIFLQNFDIYYFFLKKFVKKVESFDWIFLKNFEINFF